MVVAKPKVCLNVFLQVRLLPGPIITVRTLAWLGIHVNQQMRLEVADMSGLLLATRPWTDHAAIW